MSRRGGLHATDMTRPGTLTHLSMGTLVGAHSSSHRAPAPHRLVKEKSARYRDPRLYLASAPALALALALDSSPSLGSDSPFPGERSGSASVHDRATGV